MPEAGPTGDAMTADHIATIPHSRPLLGAEEAAAAADVLRSGQLSQGPRVAALEAATAVAVDAAPSTEHAATHAVAVSSGTAALYVALKALGVAGGDEVLIPAFACASLHQAVVHARATPRFIDCDPHSLNPDADDARRKLSSRTTACIVPHLFGLPADIAAFSALDVPVVEDCAQTLGVSVGDRRVGSFGVLTVCSFYATKLVAGGEGGMVLSRDRRLTDAARSLRDCEQSDAAEAAFNFKMSDLHAAIAQVQLRRLDDILRRRRLLAGAYREALEDAGVDLPVEPTAGGHAWFRFVVGLRATDIGSLIDRCDRRGLSCRRPVGRLAPGVDLDALPGCRSAWEESCSLPLYPALSDIEARQVPERFKAALGGADD